MNKQQETKNELRRGLLEDAKPSEKAKEVFHREAYPKPRRTVLEYYRELKEKKHGNIRENKGIS